MKNSPSMPVGTVKQDNQYGFSYWEKSLYHHFDVAIIGSGIVGLSTALSLKEQNPGLTVAVFERGMLPAGASTKNAGFACFGSLTELIADRKIMGEAAALQLVADRWEGLRLLLERLKPEAIDFHRQGGFELLKEEHLHALDELEDINEWLHPLFEEPVFSNHPDLVENFGFNTEMVETVVKNPFEGQLHPGKMIQMLAELAVQSGVRLFHGAKVNDLERTEKGLDIELRGGEFELQVLARQVVLCTNAFSGRFLPELELKPGRGLVLITEPLDKMPFRGTFHVEEGYYYFRDVGNRLLLGGGRHLDFSGEETTEFGVNELIEQNLIKLLDEVILPGIDYRISMNWSGIMAFGEQKKPIVKRKDERVVIGVRMGGMGVALGSKVGAQLAQLVLETH